MKKTIQIITILLYVICFSYNLYAVMSKEESEKWEKEFRDKYCYDMTTDEKSKMLDQQKGITYCAKEQGSAYFVFYEIPNRHDHGAPPGVCGFRVDIFEKNNRNEYIKKGRWEDLNGGDIDYDVIICAKYCAFKIWTETIKGRDYNNSKGGCFRVIIDDKGKLLAKVKYDGSREWVKLNNKYLLWDQSSESVALRNPDMSAVWIINEKANDSGDISPDCKYSYRRIGPEGKEIEIYGVDGKYRKKFILPFFDDVAHKSIPAINDKQEIIIRLDHNIYTADLKGNTKLVAVLPFYKGYYIGEDNFLKSNSFDFDYQKDGICDFDYKAHPGTKKMKYDPIILFDVNTYEIKESLDNKKTWNSIKN
jgi:hypothetical protein